MPGGTFLRSYDGVYATDRSFPATVSTFRLEQYEVTVARFRQFVTAAISGWRPLDGSGKHVHLNGGRGLVDATGGGYERGWDSTWDEYLASTLDEWTSFLQCMPQSTWTAAAGPNEDVAIGCVDWYEAYAFCIWDGGFLPSEAEWNYAASGGGEQRLFPWSQPAGSDALSCAYANYLGCDAQPAVPGSRSPRGDGRWGQADLGGNLEEWTLDWTGTFVTPCTNCANLTSTGTIERVVLGGAYDTANVTAAYIDVGDPSDHMFGSDHGIRCARAP